MARAVDHAVADDGLAVDGEWGWGVGRGDDGSGVLGHCYLLGIGVFEEGMRGVDGTEDVVGRMGRFLEGLIIRLDGGVEGQGFVGWL